MKIIIFLFSVFLLFTLNGCGTSNFENIVSPAPAERENVETNVIFQEVVWSSGEFKLKIPCDISGKLEQLPETEITQSCEIGNLKFSVSSKKSKGSLRAEFEEVKNEKAAKEAKLKDLTFIDYSHSKNSIKSSRNGTVPVSEELKFENMKNRLYLINDKWLIHLEVSCGSPEENYCKELLNKTDKQTNEFFDSLKIIK
jgi:hypothetical protein